MSKYLNLALISSLACLVIGEGAENAPEVVKGPEAPEPEPLPIPPPAEEGGKRDFKNRYSWMGKRPYGYYGQQSHYKYYGKREPEPQLGPPEAIPIAERFYNWNGEQEGKRIPATSNQFYHWNGRSADEAIPAPDSRARFYAWNGKREGEQGMMPLASNEADKRARFYAWNGKREPMQGMGPEEQEPGKRARFYAWNGKRDGGGYDGAPEAYPVGEEPGKRARFYAWNGKRADSMPMEHGEEGKRARFYAWNGKRGYAEGPPPNQEETGHPGKRFYNWQSVS